MALGLGLLRRVAQIRPLGRINPYVISFVSVFIAFVFKLLLSPFLSDTAPPFIYIVAVLISAWYGGFGPGIAATILSICIGDSGLLNHQTTATASDAISIIFFIIAGFTISFLSQARIIYEKERDAILLKEKLIRRNAEQQARIRDHFISVAAHELKSPITSQKAYVQLLRNSLTKSDQEKYLTYLNRIEKQSDKLTDFINDLLDVSKMNSRKLQYRFDYFSMRECIEEAVEQSQNLLVTHQVQIRGTSNKQVYGDKNRIFQVLTNLISNAIKYSPDAKRIVITLSETRKATTVAVEDFGIGISPEFKEKIFDRFFRVSGGDESSFKGLGLGLYLSAQIIKKHKGKIWVESEEGKGSVFCFTIPFVKKPS